MSHALTRAGQNLTLAEKRLVMLAVSKLTKINSAGVSPTTRITAAEYAEEFGVALDTAYTQLRSTAKHLYNRTLTFYEPSHRRKRNDEMVYTEVNMRWVGEAKYHKREGWVELAWWHRLVPHLVGLRKQFTQYQLTQATALRSVYSWRLLELLSMFEKTGWAQFDIQDFATAMNATEKQVANFAKVRTKIIEPAVRELTEKDGWLIEWEPIKAGRKVKSLRFTFRRNPQGSLF